jgi:gas vesicle protein
MSRIFSFFKGLQLSRIVIIAAMSFLMLFSTACSRATATDARSIKDPSGSSPNPPGQVQPYKGGMNNFDDVDTTRIDKSSVDAKAKALKDTVERNINQKGIDSPEQYVKNYRSGTPLNERIGNIGEDLGQTADEAKESLQRFGERGSKNLERNVKAVPERASRTVDQAKQNAKAAGDDIKRGIKEPVDKAGKALNRAGDAAQDRVDDTADAARRSVDRAL